MRYAYKVKTLYDGTANFPKNKRILVVENDRIEAIAPWSAEKELLDSGCLLKDYSESFAMPGMIDGHVHTVLPGDGTSAEDFFENFTSGEMLLTAAHNLQKALQSGVTTLRDCGGPPKIVFELRRAVEKGIIPGPDLLLCGSSLTTTGGHTYFFGGEVDTPEQTIIKIRGLHKQGADFVKLIATGGGTKGVIQHSQMLSCAQMEAACQEAHRLGKTATAHVCTTDTAHAAVKSGVDMLEHMIWADAQNRLAMDFSLAEEIAKKEIPICITLSVLPVSIAKLENLERPLTSAEQAEYDMLCRFRDTIYEGFRLTCGNLCYIPGTDAGWRSSAFDSLADCIIPMAELGLGNLKALHAATGLAASVLHIEDRVGTLTAGKQADFILLNASPFESIQNLRTVTAVYKKGTCIAKRQV